MKKFRIEFNGIKELLNVKIHFNSPDRITIEEITSEGPINLEIAKNIIKNEFSKIASKKVAIFKTIIKDKDSLLKNRNDNKKEDTGVTLLDVINHFGPENLRLFHNDKIFNENYENITDIIAEKLKMLYNKREKVFNLKTDEIKELEKKEAVLGKLSSKRRELNSSFVYMKLFNFIKEKIGYHADLNELASLNLNFLENSYRSDQINEEINETIYRNAYKNRVLYDKEKKCYLIPINIFGSNELKEIKLDSQNIDKKNKYLEILNIPSEKLIFNKKYKKMYLEMIISYIMEQYRTEPKNIKEWGKKQMVFKEKQVNPAAIENNEIIKEEYLKIKDIVENDFFNVFFVFPYQPGHGNFFKTYFDYVNYVIGRILYKNFFIKNNIVYEKENYLKRFFAYQYFSNRHRFDNIFNQNFVYNFKKLSEEAEKTNSYINFEQINKNFKDEKFSKDEKNKVTIVQKEKNEIPNIKEIFNMKTDEKSSSKNITGKLTTFEQLKPFGQEKEMQELFTNMLPNPNKEVDLETLKRMNIHEKRKVFSNLLKERLVIKNIEALKEKEEEEKKESKKNAQKSSKTFSQTEAKKEKSENLKSKIFERFKQIMAEKILEDGENRWYIIDISQYYLDFVNIKEQEIIKAAVFKEIIDELRPYIIGTLNAKGKIVKKKVKLSDYETINKISDFKAEQFKIYQERIKEKEEQKIKYISKKIEKHELKKWKKNNSAENLENFKKKIKEKMLDLIALNDRKKNIIEEEMKIQFKKYKQKNSNYSLNFKLKNIKKKEALNDFSKKEPVAIFFEDIYNFVNSYKHFCFAHGEKKLFEKISENEFYDLGATTKKAIKSHNERLVPINVEYVFILVFLKLRHKFEYVVPFLRKYSNEISDKFITVAFFSTISEASKFIEGAVISPFNLDIIKSKYNLFLQQSEVKKEVPVLEVAADGKKIIKKYKMNYREYLESKYKKNLKISKTNPFEITEGNMKHYGDTIKNSYKYHRIFGENIKYLFTGINSEYSVIIKSKLFKNYGPEYFLSDIIILDRILNKCYNFLGNENEIKVELKNFIPKQKKFTLNANGADLGNVELKFEVNMTDYSIERYEKRIEKLLEKLN